jgi:perosamine synthetase
MKNQKVIPVSHPALIGNEKTYVNECLDTGWISSVGRFIPLFEKAFSQFCSVDYAVACSSGTTALHLALTALGVRPQDEVLIPTLTYVATANAVRYCGATPVLVDSEPRTMNINPDLVERAITPRTKGVIVVHLYGHPVDMDPILAIARRHNLFVLEDAAEAHGARYKGRTTGGLADVAVFSFFGNKIITTGEGGMVTSNSNELNRQLQLLRGQGMDPTRRYWFPQIGYNYRMTNIQAALGLAQLENASSHLAARRRVAEWYKVHLEAVQDLITLPIEEPWAYHAFWMHTILLDNEINRDQFMQILMDHGIETRPVFYPMHVMPVYREPDGSYPAAEDLARRGVSLPTHGLLTEEDVDRIAKTIHQTVRARAAAAR